MSVMLRIKVLGRNPWVRTVGVALFCLALFGAGYWTNEQARSPEEKLITSAYRTIANDSLFNRQSHGALSYAAVRGMISVIDDPYAELIEPDAAVNFTNAFVGKTGVVGLYAQNIDGQVVIEIVYPEGPAERAGLKEGDIILEIDGVKLDSEADSSETGLLIRGTPDSTVHITVLRDGQTMEFAIVRQLRDYVTVRMLPGQIGYIALNAFNEVSVLEMSDELEALLAQHPSGLVWDLRKNEGGDMQAAQVILSYFIEDGLLFTAELTQDRTVPFVARGKALAPDIPLVVLMDKTTYSAAETCAAAVAETGRGKTVGSHSFGKGVIQATLSLPGENLLQMTIAKWLSPTGAWYQDHGVAPQVAVYDDPATEEDELLNQAVAILAGE